ncbi:MAG: NUDIX domain-containing protein [Candidatus Portnoybacteria bacterium]|nr:NUDIX domain-containing protein [Candidatus Portnoybacteria bacterium]
MDKKFEIIVRLVFLKNNKILFCKQKTEDYYFLPGGHVEFGESVNDSIGREIAEELDAMASEISFIGAIENIFSDEDGNHHELNLVFSARLDKDDALSKENHLEFAWVDADGLESQTIYPIALKNSLIKWLEDRKIFWASQKK